MGLGGLDQILQLAIGGFREGAAFSWPHRHPELHRISCHLGSLGNALVTSVAVHHRLIAMQQLAGLGEVMHVGGRSHNRVVHTGVLVDSGMDLHPEIPLVALPGLVHLWIALPLFVFGGAGCRDQGGINDGALLHRHAPCDEAGFDGLKDLLAQIMFLQQLAEGQDRRLIGDPIADQLDASKAAHGGHLDQRIFHRWITEAVPLLQQVNPQHGGQRIRRPAAFLAGLGVVGFDQLDKRLPWHHHIHLREKLLPLGLLLGRGEFVIREAELLAAHQPSPGLRLRPHCPAVGLGFPEPP